MTGITNIDSKAIAAAAASPGGVSEEEAMDAADVADIPRMVVKRYKSKGILGRHLGSDVAGHIIADAVIDNENMEVVRRFLMDQCILKEGGEMETKVKAADVLIKMRNSNNEARMVLLKAVEIASNSKTVENENSASPSGEIHTTYIQAENVQIGGDKDS